MIDFALAMTLSSAPDRALCKTTGKLIVKTLFLLIFLVQFSFTSHAQCAYTLNEAQLNGENIPLSAIEKTNNSELHYWFEFTANTKYLRVNLENAGEYVDFRIGEAASNKCVESSLIAQGFAAEKSGRTQIFYSEFLIPGKKYFVVLSHLDLNASLVFRAVNDLNQQVAVAAKGLPGKTNTVRKAKKMIKREIVVDHDHYPPLYVSKRKRASQKNKVTRQQLESNIEALEARIAAYEKRSDQAPGTLDKMKIALKNRQQQLNNID